MSSVKKIAIVVFVFTAFLAAGYYLGTVLNPKEKEPVKRTTTAMGTLIEVMIRNADDKTAQAAIDSVFTEMYRIDSLFSDYSSNSPVWKLNTSTDSVFLLSGELAYLVSVCDSMNKLTNGAFDASLGRLMAAWGFRGEVQRVPSAKVLDSAFAFSGWKHIAVKNNSLFRSVPVFLDFGAVAKGYAIDRAAAILERMQVEEYLLNIGGEIRQRGEWTIGVAHPREQGQFIAKLSIGDKTTATSGDYERCFFEDGIRYHHLLDPKTGKPAGSCQSVTVIAESGLLADCLSTGVFVLGSIDGMALIERLPDAEAMIIDSTGSVFYSSGFKNFMR